jgi:hypothetical protein
MSHPFSCVCLGVDFQGKLFSKKARFSNTPQWERTAKRFLFLEKLSLPIFFHFRIEIKKEPRWALFYISTNTSYEVAASAFSEACLVAC